MENEVLEIEITEDDSQNGCSSDNGDCPVARAFSRAIGCKPCHAGFSIVYEDGNVLNRYLLPAHLTEQIYPFVSSLGEIKINPGKYTLKRMI